MTGHHISKASRPMGLLLKSLWLTYQEHTVLAQTFCEIFYIMCLDLALSQVFFKTGRSTLMNQPKNMKDCRRLFTSHPPWALCLKIQSCIKPHVHLVIYSSLHFSEICKVYPNYNALVQSNYLWTKLVLMYRKLIYDTLTVNDRQGNSVYNKLGHSGFVIVTLVQWGLS